MYFFTYDTNVSKVGFEVSAYIGTPLLPSTIGMLEMEVISFCLPKLTLNLALMAGSSKQGKARLASVGWNCVTAMYLEKHLNHFVKLCKYSPYSSSPVVKSL